jgi:tRNA threonylcarbamoyladenosine modification (KEOPS) complex  Pcc1 subunit
MHAATLRLACPDARAASAVRDALAVEASDGPEGTTLVLAVEGPALLLRVAAVDLAALRAALNGAVRLADAALGALAAHGNG